MNKLKNIKLTRVHAAAIIFIAIILLSVQVRQSIDRTEEQRALEAAEAETAAAQQVIEDLSGKDSFVPEVEISEEDLEAISNYNGLTQEVSDILCRFVWQSEGRSSTLTFLPGVSRVLSGNSEEQALFVLDLVEKDQEEDLWTGSYHSTDDNLGIFTLSKQTKDEETYYVFSSQDFGSEDYLSRPLKTSIELVNTDEVLSALFSDNQAKIKLNTTLNDYCAERYPDATQATWQNEISLNYEEGLIHLSFELNDSHASHINVQSSFDGTNFEITER